MSKLLNAIRDVIHQIREAFPDVTIFYEYKEDSDTHFFKVLPFTISSSREFKEFTADLRFELMKAGIDLAIGFLSEDSLTQLSDDAMKSAPTPKFQLELQKFLTENSTFHRSEQPTLSGLAQIASTRDASNYALAA